jgi:hypothetical protein
VFCGEADVEDAADEVCEVEVKVEVEKDEVEADEDCDTLEDRSTDEEDTEALVCTEGDAEPDKVIDPEIEAEEARDRMNVGVSTVVGTALLSVG